MNSETRPNEGFGESNCYRASVCNSPPPFLPPRETIGCDLSNPQPSDLRLPPPVAVLVWMVILLMVICLVLTSFVWGPILLLVYLFDHDSVDWHWLDGQTDPEPK
jgi:hypothetical protein